MGKRHRRQALKAIAAGAPTVWMKPAVDSVVLPVHARTSVDIVCDSPGQVEEMVVTCADEISETIRCYSICVPFQGTRNDVFVPVACPENLDDPPAYLLVVISRRVDIGLSSRALGSGNCGSSGDGRSNACAIEADSQVSLVVGLEDIEGNCYQIEATVDYDGTNKIQTIENTTATRL